MNPVFVVFHSLFIRFPIRPNLQTTFFAFYHDSSPYVWFLFSRRSIPKKKLLSGITGHFLTSLLFFRLDNNILRKLVLYENSLEVKSLVYEMLI